MIREPGKRLSLTAGRVLRQSIVPASRPGPCRGDPSGALLEHTPKGNKRLRQRASGRTLYHAILGAACCRPGRNGLDWSLNPALSGETRFDDCGGFIEGA